MRNSERAILASLLFLSACKASPRPVAAETPYPTQTPLPLNATATAVELIRYREIATMAANTQDQEDIWKILPENAKDFIVSFKIENIYGGNFCTGTIIRKNYVLDQNKQLKGYVVYVDTSAHCLTREVDKSTISSVRDAETGKIREATSLAYVVFGDGPVGVQHALYALYMDTQEFEGLSTLDFANVSKFSDVNDYCIVSGWPFFNAEPKPVIDYVTNLRPIDAATIQGDTRIANYGISGGPLLCKSNGGLSLKGQVQYKIATERNTVGVSHISFDDMDSYKEAFRLLDDYSKEWCSKNSLILHSSH